MSEVHFETPMQALLKFKSIFLKEHSVIQERRMANDEPDQQRQSYQRKEKSIVNSRIAVRIKKFDEQISRKVNQILI